MRVGIATVQVPFVRGGAEMLAENLAAQVRAAGHEAEIISIPFKWYPPRRIPEAMAVCRMLDLTESSGTRIDRLVGLKFPAYMISKYGMSLLTLGWAAEFGEAGIRANCLWPQTSCGTLRSATCAARRTANTCGR